MAHSAVEETTGRRAELTSPKSETDLLSPFTPALSVYLHLPFFGHIYAMDGVTYISFLGALYWLLSPCQVYK